MAHKDKTTKQVRVWLRPETVRQAKLMTLLLARDDWNQVVDDALRVGLAYMNEVGKLEIAEWKSSMRLVDLKEDLKLRTMRGALPMPEERD